MIFLEEREIAFTQILRESLQRYYIFFKYTRKTARIFIFFQIELIFLAGNEGLCTKGIEKSRSGTPARRA